MSKFKFGAGKRGKIRTKGLILTLIESVGLCSLTFGIIIALLMVITPGKPEKKIEDFTNYLKNMVGIKQNSLQIEDNSILGNGNKESSNSKNVDSQEEKKLEATAPVENTSTNLETNNSNIQNKNENVQANTVNNNQSNGINDPKYANNLYYSQLNNYAKIIYNKLSNESAYLLNGFHTFEFGNTFNELLNTPGGDEQLNLAFQAGVNALVLDYPQLFFIEVSNISLSIKGTRVPPFNTVYYVSITNSGNKSFYTDGLNTREDVDSMRNQLEQLRADVLAKARENSKNDVEFIRYIHDFVTGRISYDDSIQDNTKYNLYGAAIHGRAVCEGYAKLTKYLLDGAGIPTVIVVGDGINSRGGKERHAWNMVYVNNAWYGIDTTWDDPIVIGGNSSKIPASERYKYFLVGAEQFAGNHKEDGNISPNIYFNYPTLAPTKLTIR